MPQAPRPGYMQPPDDMRAPPDARAVPRRRLPYDHPIRVKQRADVAKRAVPGSRQYVPPVVKIGRLRRFFRRLFKKDKIDYA